MKRLMPKLAAGVLLLASITPTLTYAASDLMRDCRADYRKFCSATQPGGGRIADCLKQHQAELSPSCQASIVTLGECGEAAKKICGADAAGSTFRECVKANADAFSPACQAALPTR
jgi:hypothetical protein